MPGTCLFHHVLVSSGSQFASTVADNPLKASPVYRLSCSRGYHAFRDRQLNPSVETPPRLTHDLVAGVHTLLREAFQHRVVESKAREASTPWVDGRVSHRLLHVIPCRFGEC